MIAKLKMKFVLTLLTLVLATVTANSGIKFGFDTKLFKAIKSVDYNKYFQNKTITPEGGLDFDKSSFPSFKVHLDKTLIRSIKNPGSVDVFTRVEGENHFLNVVIKNIEVRMTTDFKIKAMSVFSDEKTNSAVGFVIDKIDSEFTFVNGLVKFNKLDVKVEKIDIQFDSYFFRFINWIGNWMIVKGVNKSMGDLHKILSEKINSFITSDTLIDVGFGIGINVTNVDKPELDVVTKSNVREVSNLRGDILNEKIQSSILKFGIQGSIYANLMPDLRPSISDPVDMQFFNYSFNNAISLLISDYSINTLLFMAQQTGYLKMTFTNETNTILPFNIDTQGLSAIIPEYPSKYNETYPVEMKINVSPLDNVQPLLTTLEHGNYLSFNFGMDFNTYNSTDPFDDPINDLKLNITASLKLQYIITDKKLNVLILKTTIDNMDVLVDELKIDADQLKTNLEGLLNTIIKSYKPSLRGIDVVDKLNTLTGLKFSNMILDAAKNYLVLSINVD